MKYVTRLITSRPMEKGVQYFGPDPRFLAGVAQAWLETQGKPGDRFVIVEFKEEVVRTLRYEDAIKPMKDPIIVEGVDWAHTASANLPPCFLCGNKIQTGQAFYQLKLTNAVRMVEICERCAAGYPKLSDDRLKEILK